MEYLREDAGENKFVQYASCFLGAGILVALTSGIFLMVSEWSLQQTVRWPGFTQLMEALPEPIAWLRWVVGDMSEAVFYKHEFASLGMLLGALIAYKGFTSNKTWQGFPIAYGTGLWPNIICASTLGLLLSNLLWGWVILIDSAWQPTFVTFVSLPAAIVLVFGKGIKNIISGACLGALLVTPCAILIVKYVCGPLSLPSVIGNVSGMALGSIIAFILCKHFPWLIYQGVTEEPQTSEQDEDTEPVDVEKHGGLWTVRRVLADLTEAPFFGNEIAGLGLLIGVLIAVLLNPLSPAYGSGLLAPIVITQVLTSAIGVIVWRHQWIARGWYPTFVPVVSVGPAAVLTYGGDTWVIVASALLGALFGPPVAAAISDRLPQYMHPYIGNVASMAICTAVLVPSMKFLL